MARLTRIAVLSLHTSPLASLGSSKAGGMNYYVRRIAEQLGAGGVAVDVFTRRDAPATPEVVLIAPGARLVHVAAGPAEPLENEPMIPFTAQFAAGVEAFRAREALRYDLLHSHYWLSVEAGDELARAWGTPHLAMFHTLGEVKLRARASEREPKQRLEAERRLVHCVDRIVAASEHERQLLRQMFRVPPQCVTVIPLGVDLERFQPRDAAVARAALALPAGERVLLAVGRMEPLKGFDIIVRALAQMTQRERVRLLLVGGDERAAAEFARLRAIAQEEGVAGRVHFLGAIPHERLAVYYNAADVVVAPSFYESFGLVALEAMASGVPVVASRVGGLVSTIADGRTGYLVPWRCPEPFAEKIDLLLSNEALRRALGAAARQSVQQYAWAHVATALRALYELVLEQAETGAATPAAAPGGQ
ncbi:MAG: glycosyltransferase family 1 protein [Dehalococcoidia bacterium]|nr:glycosyltransferase family 1 protein [Dehalococcoidia bacterium]